MLRLFAGGRTTDDAALLVRIRIQKKRRFVTTVSNTLLRQAARLFPDAEDSAEFVQALQRDNNYPVAVVWLQQRPSDAPFSTLSRPDWLPEFVDLVPFQERPGRHALHEQGAFYCVDPSSVFMALGAMQLPRPEVLLDVCASPGGKSILTWRALQPQQLWCNEVVGKRLGALTSNLKRCRIAPSSVISADPAVLALHAAGTADIVLVDAPCSGQSLIARGKPSPGCFHPATINMNANRQRKILSSSVQLVRPGGWLVYMTCTYAEKENERNVDWLLKKNSQLSVVEVPELPGFRSTFTNTPCYRMWPMSGLGAGGFFAVLQRSEAAEIESPGDLQQLRVRLQVAVSENPDSADLPGKNVKRSDFEASQDSDGP